MGNLITRANVEETAAAIREACPGCAPEVGIVLGSGMDSAGFAIEARATIPYAQLPHMVPSTVEGHRGQFVIGAWGGKQVICMQGRFHAYEGHDAQQLTFPVYVMKELGIKAYIVTNAAGGINESYGVGDIMVIGDHINFQGINAIIGDVPELGPRFFDMTYGYSLELRALAKQVAHEKGIAVHEGVYIGVLGPSFETPAEIRAFRVMGADAVGMSTVQEVIAANHLGLKVLGLSMISNPAAGVCDEPLDMEEVSLAAHQAATNITALVEGVLEAI